VFNKHLVCYAITVKVMPSDSEIVDIIKKLQSPERHMSDDLCMSEFTHYTFHLSFLVVRSFNDVKVKQEDL